jgi:hypothetical protein
MSKGNRRRYQVVGLADYYKSVLNTHAPETATSSSAVRYPSSTSRASFSCLAKKVAPPTSGCMCFIKRLYSARICCSVAPAVSPRISSSRSRRHGSMRASARGCRTRASRRHLAILRHRRRHDRMGGATHLGEMGPRPAGRLRTKPEVGTPACAPGSAASCSRSR